MGDAVPQTVLKPHQMFGYWGYGSQPDLEHLVENVLSQRGEYQTARRFGQSSHPHSGSTNAGQSLVWGIAYLGLSQAECLALPARLIAALSASGQGCVDEFYPSDAWVRLHDQRLTLGREPFGRMPLYWAQIGQLIWFASRLSLLLPLVETPQLSIPALYGYSCFSYVPTPLTPVAQVMSLPAGTEQTWSVAEETCTLSAPVAARSLEWREAMEQIQEEAIAVSQLQTLLKAAIARQVADLADEPVGVLLSGGLDSSIVAALLVNAGVKVRAYTLDFGTAGNSEYPYAEQVAEFLNIPLIKVDASPRRIRQALIPTVQALDLPFGDGVTVPLFLLMQAASQDVRVIFNGEGGDQLFAGWTNKPLIAAGLYQTTQATEDSFEQQYRRTFHRLWGYEAQIFQPALLAQINHLQPQAWLQEALDPTFSTALLHRLRRATLMLKGAQNIHPRATQLGLAHSLQVRSPFCDLPLAQWTFQLSGELHLQAACEKYILKRSVEAWLPPEIVWRQKRGMGVPLTSWCFNGLWRDLGVWLNPGRLRHQGLWQPDLASRLAAGELGTIQGRRIGESLWLLMTWQVWQQVFLGEGSVAYSLDHPFWLPSPLGQQYLRLQRDRKQW